MFSLLHRKCARSYAEKQAECDRWKARVDVLESENEQLRQDLQEAQEMIENIDTTDTGYGETYTRG